MNENIKKVPDEWRGNMNCTYTLGGFFNNNRTLTLNVFNERKISKIHNVIGMIEVKMKGYYIRFFIL